MSSPDSSAEVLRRTSRTFALSIQLLPRAMRAPVRVAYLLARIADTVTDSAGAPPAVRRELLGAFRRAVGGSGDVPPLESLALEARRDDEVTARAEAALLAGAAAWLAEAEGLPGADRASVRRVVGTLVKTMEAELVLLEGAAPGGIAALPDARALSVYTEGIAGCVGAFWIELAIRHGARVPHVERRSLSISARRYGRALQLVNVVRDLGPDLARGLCLLPRDELERAGLSPDGLARAVASPDERRRAARALAPVVAPWLARSRRGLIGGLAATARLRRAGWRLRTATSLPAALGLATLARLPGDPAWLDPGAKVSIGRAGVRRVSLLAALASIARRGPLALSRIGRGNKAPRGA